LRLVAIPAVHRTIAARLKRHGGLLAAAGTDHCRSSCLRSLVSSATAAARLGFLCLTTGLAALGRGIAAFLEERLIFARKGEFLTTVATGELQIASHGESSSLPLYDIILYFPEPVNPKVNLSWDQRGFLAHFRLLSYDSCARPGNGIMAIPE
jgi:hypothetical protein